MIIRQMESTKKMGDGHAFDSAFLAIRTGWMGSYKSNREVFEITAYPIASKHERMPNKKTRGPTCAYDMRHRPRIAVAMISVGCPSDEHRGWRRSA